MSIWNFHSAGSLVFGMNAVQNLGEIAKRFRFRRVLIVTDETLNRIGIVKTISAPLQAAGIEVEVFTGCQPEPPLPVIRSGIEVAKMVHPDAIIGLGGGSNMDAAKLIALVLAHGGDPTDWVGDSRVPGPIFPLICVPTTAGTGSEVSAAAVFTDTEKQMKVSTLSPFMRPLVAVVDPALTMDCPKQVTADSGIDALTHAIEAYTAATQNDFLQREGGATVYQGHNPMSDIMAQECIRLVGKFLSRAFHNGHDQEAREGMALAATLGGLAFANAGVALIHAMEYPVGGAVHVSHGAGNGLLLPYVMKYNLLGREDRMADIAKFLGVHVDGMSATDASQAGIQAIEKLRVEIGIPSRLRDLGVKEEMLSGFAEKAFGIKRLMRVNPRIPQTADEILSIYRAAY